MVLVRSATGSYPVAGLAAAAYGLGTAVSAPLAGAALDRLGQRRVLPVLAAAYAVSLVLVAAAAGHLGTGALGFLATAAGMTRPPLEAAVRAVWPQLVPAQRLDVAYALDSTAQELIWIGGPLLFAVLLAVGSPQLPLLACAALTLAGAIGYATSRRLATSGPTPAPGTRRPLRSAALRVLLGMAALYGVATGTLTVSLVAFAGAHGGTPWVGVLVAIWGAASLPDRGERAGAAFLAAGAAALAGTALGVLWRSRLPPASGAAV